MGLVKILLEDLFVAELVSLAFPFSLFAPVIFLRLLPVPDFFVLTVY